MQTRLIDVVALTCYRQTGCAAGNGSQVVYRGDALIGPLVGLIVLWVDHVVEEQRAIGKYISPLVWHQAHEGAVFLPLDACRCSCVAVGRTVEQCRVPPDGQCVLRLHCEPEGAEGLRCWTWRGNGREQNRDISWACHRDYMSCFRTGALG